MPGFGIRSPRYPWYPLHPSFTVGIRSARLSDAFGSPSAHLTLPRLHLALHASFIVGIRSARLRLRLALHDRPDDPRRKFRFADPRQLALASLARGHRHDLLEDLPAHLGQRRALEDHAT